MFGPKKKKIKRPVIPNEMDLPETDEAATEQAQAAAQAQNEADTADETRPAAASEQDL